MLGGPTVRPKASIEFKKCSMNRHVMPYLHLCAIVFFMGPVSTRDNRVLKGPLGRSLRSFARTAHSAHSLRSAMLASLARSVHGLAHSLRSLPRGTVDIHESVFTLKTRFTGTIEILVVTRNTPHFFFAYCRRGVCQ